MTQPTEGMPAPQFEGTDQNGNIVKLSTFAGKKGSALFLSQR